METLRPVEPSDARGNSSPAIDWDLTGGDWVEGNLFEESRAEGAQDFFAADANSTSLPNPLEKDPLAPPAAIVPARWNPLAGGIFMVPAWLASMVVHLVVVTTLALVAYDTARKSEGPVIASSFVAADPLEMEEIVFKPQQLEELAELMPEPDAAVSGAMDADSFLSAPTDVEVFDNQAMAAAIAAGELSDNLAGGSGGGSGQKRGKGELSGAEFFGVQASGKRFVFIVDSSRSMRGARFSAAKRELIYAIRKLGKDQSFFVMFFDQNTEIMTFAPKTTPEKLPVKATRENIAKLEKWVNGVRNEVQTDPYEAVRIALDIMPDAAYLLTDGRFTDRGKTISFLNEQNFVDDPLVSPNSPQRRPKVMFHTIGFSSREGEEALKYIAKLSGGTYRFVPTPNSGRR